MAVMLTVVYVVLMLKEMPGVSTEEAGVQYLSISVSVKVCMYVSVINTILLSRSVFFHGLFQQDIGQIEHV